MTEIIIKTPQKEYFTIRESILESVIKDIVSLGMLTILCWLNVKYFGNHSSITIFCIFFYFLYVVSRPGRKIQNIDEAIKYLQDLKKENK